MTVKTMVSIDIETAGRSEKATVLTVGAVVFVGPDMKEIASVHLNMNIEEQRNVMFREWDRTTLEWWDQQPAELRDFVFKSSDLPVATSLDLLTVMIGRADEYWANSPNFDLDILGSLYADCGQESPFDFRKQRDYRTLVALYEKIRGTPWVKSRKGVVHDALDDARNQGLDIVNILKDLKGERV